MGPCPEKRTTYLIATPLLGRDEKFYSLLILGCTDRGVEQNRDTPHTVCRLVLLDEGALFLCACD